MQGAHDDIRERLIQRTREDVLRLREAITAGDTETMKRLGHRLHGAAGAMGLDRLAELGQRVEIASRGEDARAVAPLVDAIAEEVARAPSQGGSAS